MPIGPIPPGCIAICAPAAFDAVGDIQLTGICSQATGGLTLSNVAVTACSASGFDFLLLPESPESVAVVIVVQVQFTFHATIDGFSFDGSATCLDFLTAVRQLVTSPDRFAEPLDCAADLTCSAVPVPFDAENSIQSFIVTVAGTATCVACSGTFSVVAASAEAIPSSVR